METQTAVSSFAVESGDISSKFDDDGRKKRTGIYICISFTTLSTHTTL